VKLAQAIPARESHQQTPGRPRDPAKFGCRCLLEGNVVKHVHRKGQAGNGAGQRQRRRIGNQPTHLSWHMAQHSSRDIHSDQLTPVAAP
jgi:hypothetical protein